MERLDWRIEQEGQVPLCGSAEPGPGALIIAPELPAGRLTCVRARMHVTMGPEDRAFFNGYQSWTHCPEYRRGDRIPGIKRLPKPLVKHFGLERYGDYAFVDYPERPGCFHGESWCYFRGGERFRLIASLDERAGYTLFRYDAGSGILDIERDCAGLDWEGGVFPAFELFFRQGSEDAVFDAWFAAMDVRPRTRERLAGYTSWYNRYQNISASSIRQDLDGCAGRLRPGDLFQIDDGWEPFVGDWLEADGKKFPDGMGAAAEAIRREGFRPGLWLAPFVAERKSALYREKPDWFLREPNGDPWYLGSNWSGFYALDIDNPEVVAYLERVFRQVFDDWGYELVKLDFLYAAAPFGTERETRAGRMYRAMELLRGLCGEKRILGCGVPLMPSFGLVDYCRIGCDVGLSWRENRIMRIAGREHPSTRRSLDNTIFRRQLNGRAWLNDPDVFFLRADNLHMSEEEKHCLATADSLLGGVLLHSDDMGAWDAAARAAYSRLLQNGEARSLRVRNEDGLGIEYELKGSRRELLLPGENKT